MKGCNKWSYATYKPFLTDLGDIYICRIVPYAESIHLEWLERGEAYSVYYRRYGIGDFTLAGITEQSEFTVENLDTDTDYEFFVGSGEKKSLIRLAHTGSGVGTAVNYLHLDDEAYDFLGRFLCSPSLVKLPSGAMLASMDLFEPSSPQNLTLIFCSDDGGATWHYRCELMPCFWGKLFVHKGELYMLSVSTEYGDLLIGKSTDEGKSFCAPIILLHGSNGKNGHPGVHKCPQNIFRHNGRIHESLEWGAWRCRDGYFHAAMVMSCDENDNLLDHDAPDAPLKYSHTIKMEGNHSKFMIKYDEVRRKYYSIVSRIDSPEHIHCRNLLSLMASDDLENWEVVCDLIDRRGGDGMKIGFQYVDFEFDGDNIIFLCRTAINGADSFHNSSYITFHRVKAFRSPDRELC